ncbi:class I SAM-dependent RNA methyltransferase [Microbacterium sp. dk485]|uniref:class I SAM-dependent RNA methyltransferase n=1 Tax=Microbacterium sp. dk485 TaxID=2560021 RepID=UPI0010746FAD|nr:TRAM domain-containing protein [Microbacterium sp. dk485]TFV83818.1 class I SAM-dependent RNA methyltransferase [Microbacterium sp. dk485]
METGDLVELEITDVAHGGVFVARLEGRVVFVADAIPGERVRARLSDTRKKSFWRAETVEVLTSSPHRRPHVWAAADVTTPPEQRPGGADFGHIDLPHQRELKLKVFRDALERIGKVDVPVTMQEAVPIVDASGAVLAQESPDATQWRTRVSLHVDEDGRIGPFAARSHRVIEVDDLPLATPAVARAAAGLRGQRPGRVDLVQPADGRARILPRPDGEAPPPAEVILEQAGGREFRVDAGGFWQVHRLAAHSLTTIVAEELRAVAAVDPDAAHLDLYGGVGLFAATLGDLGGPGTRVTSVESDPRATEHAGENLAEWVGARAVTARVDRFVRQLAAESSPVERERLSRGVVLLDPPRAGAGRDVVEGILALAPAAVVYVACDPVALARDLGIFRDAGYRAPRPVRAVDLFPHSHHVEAVAVLTP